MRAFLLLMAAWFSFVPLAASCTADPMPEKAEIAPEKGTPEPQKDESPMKAVISVGGKRFTADIEDTETGRAFLEKLPMTLEMAELNGNEKYCYGVSLPRNDQYCGSIAAGDIMLYSGNCIVLFYGPAGGFSYTRIGRIADVAGLADALGEGSVSVRFEKP